MQRGAAARDPAKSFLNHKPGIVAAGGTVGARKGKAGGAMKIRAAVLIFLLSGGCAVTPTAPVVDAAAGPCAVNAGGGAPGDWLIGRWSQPHNSLVIRRQGPTLVYEWEREPGVMTERWGEKAPARGEGQVTRIAGCSVEMSGAYVWSTTDAIIGREMTYKLALTESTVLQGEWYGAGYSWLRAFWRKVE